MKTTKHIFFTFLAMFILSVWTVDVQAGDVRFNGVNDTNGKTDAGADQLAKYGVTLSVSRGFLASSNGQYRIYIGETLTISSTVGAITKIAFTCTAMDDAKYGPGGFSIASGEYSYEGITGTWTGNADEVVFQAEYNQVRATEIVVTVDGDTPVDQSDIDSPLSFIKVIDNQGNTYWTEIFGLVDGTNIEIYNSDVGKSAISNNISGSVDLNEVWSESDGKGTHYQVTSIGDYAFFGCSGLTSITIPSSVTSIRDSAFEGCSSLTIITIPSSVTYIGNRAFSGCSGFTSITIPSSVTSIGYYAFYDCCNLQEVEINSQTIGSWFSGHSSIQKIILGEQVTKIGEYAFSSCSGLTSVTIPSSVTSIGSLAFSGCSGLTSVTIPSSVMSIGFSAFEGCSGLISVTIPSSVMSIGGAAFSGCSGLTSVTIPSSVMSIGEAAFSGCSGLTSVTIPSSVMSIGNSAFYRCSRLTTLTIPSSVTFIGDKAFSGCTNLKDVISEITDVFVTGSEAFKGCENATLHVPAGTYVAYSGRADWNRIIHIEEAAPAEEGSQMTLACNTKGSVLVNGKTTFTNKIKDVEVNEEEENTFEFIPNEGCRLEQVTLNGLDVTLSVSNNKLTTMIPANSQMMVVFSKGNDINGDGNVDIGDVVSLVNLILGQ